MNSLPDTVSTCAQRFASLPRRILSILERLTLRLQHRHLVLLAAGQDAWYLHSAGQTSGPETIEDILERLAAGESPLAVLHASSIDESDPEWRILRHANWCADRATVAVWVITFWLLALLVAWMLVAQLHWR